MASAADNRPVPSLKFMRSSPGCGYCLLGCQNPPLAAMPRDVAPARGWADNSQIKEVAMNERVNPSVARPVLSQRAGVNVRRVGVNLGAEVSGVDLRHPLPD